METTIAQMEPSLVVRNRNDRLTIGFETRQQTFIEKDAVFRILVCGKLIKQKYRSVFEQCHHQC
jgi:hypothetical protein